MLRRTSPREKMAMLFLISELILGLAFLVSLLVLKYSISRMDLNTAKNEVRLSQAAAKHPNRRLLVLPLLCCSTDTAHVIYMATDAVLLAPFR